MPLKWLQIIQALPGHPSIAREHLAIAFLVGAMRASLKSRVTSPEMAKQELLNLLTSFTDDTPEEYIVYIFRCPDINKPVVRLLHSNYSPYYQHGLDSLIQGRRTVVLTPEFAIGQPSVSSLNEKLFQEIGLAICSGRFSFHSGDYHAFNLEEHDFIDGSTGL